MLRADGAGEIGRFDSVLLVVAFHLYGPIDAVLSWLRFTCVMPLTGLGLTLKMDRARPFKSVGVVFDQISNLLIESRSQNVAEGHRTMIFLKTLSRITNSIFDVRSIRGGGGAGDSVPEMLWEIKAWKNGSILAKPSIVYHKFDATDIVTTALISTKFRVWYPVRYGGWSNCRLALGDDLILRGKSCCIRRGHQAPVVKSEICCCCRCCRCCRCCCCCCSKKQHKRNPILHFFPVINYFRSISPQLIDSE